MKTPGEMLREARVEKGLSLSDAAAMTRISRTMLAHLERDRYDEFNAEVFVRGHLRNYARDLSISPDAVLQAYERHIGAATPSRPPQRSTSSAPATASSAVVTTAGKSRKHARVAAPTKMSRPKPSGGASWQGLAAKVGPTQAVAVLLVLVGLVVFASLLSGNRATAKDPAQYPTTNREAWELEQDVEETRWLLEQPVQAAESAEPKKR